MKHLNSAKLEGKRVLVRLDLDLPQSGKTFDTTRLQDGIPTLEYLFSHKCIHITVIAHRGRPEKASPRYSLSPIEKLLRAQFTPEQNERLSILPNLRFDPREEKGSKAFAKELVKDQDFFILDAFATAHRKHTSIVFIPELLPSYVGLQFEKELKAFDKVLLHPKRPFVVILGGAKLETKLPLIQCLENKADIILVGGKLAVEARKQGIAGRKLIIGELTKDGKDLAQPAIDQFIRFVKVAGTILWNGPMGVFEEPAHAHGTKQLALALNECTGFTLTGGGDTEAAQSKYKAEDHINHISSGGGSMLEYLEKGTLPGIEAIESSQKLFNL